MTLFAFPSTYNQFVALNLEIKTAATAVLLLNSLEEDIVVKVCNGICSFAEKGTACSEEPKTNASVLILYNQCFDML